ncbi:hypothetical protein EHO58_13735 [Leptospira selangorensis]|uniref:hypothetical protein n=1 Tax=Leptospira selangorensis TaxID=2484982 RepID=UPI00108350DA|nr:hypothetical protein [Leptospira selangorensis]TGK03480.1 hypothetical protein EHO58_13735 [Leptospira selangorensis]
MIIRSLFFLTIIFPSYGCIYRSMTSLPTVPKQVQNNSIKPVRLQVFLAGDRCIEFCKKEDKSPNCDGNTNICKSWIKDWMPADFASGNAVSSVFKYYPPRKKWFIEQISHISTELCKTKKDLNCFYDSPDPSDDQNYSSTITVKVGGFQRRIHWSLYPSSFSLLLFPGFFKEEWNIEISRIDLKNRVEQIHIPSTEVKHWFGWPFIFWGAALAISDEKVLTEIIEYSLHYNTASNP